MNISALFVQKYFLFVTIAQFFKLFIVINVEVKRVVFSASNGLLNHSLYLIFSLMFLFPLQKPDSFLSTGVHHKFCVKEPGNDFQRVAEEEDEDYR